MGRRLNEIADATLFNPLMYAALRRRGLYTWGNAVRLAGLLLLGGGAVARFVSLQMDFALADRAHPSLRATLRMERLLWFDSNPFEEYAFATQLWGVAFLLATLGPALARDLLRFPASLLGYRPKPLLPEDLRIAPLTTRQAIACDDAPFLLALLGLLPGLLLTLLPCRPVIEVLYGRVISLGGLGPGGWIEIDLALIVFMSWVALFTLHRILQMLLRARFRRAVRSRWGTTMFYGGSLVCLAGWWVYEFARRVERYGDLKDRAIEVRASLVELGSGPLPIELHGPRLLLLAACACFLLACHSGVEWIRRTEEESVV